MARAEDIVKAGSAAILSWAFLREDGSPATFIHRCFRREVWREGGVQTRLELCAGVLAWPFVILPVVGFFTWCNGPSVRKRTGRGIVRQMCEQIKLAATRAILPPWYYIFELHEDDKRHRAGEYLNRFETKRFLYPFLRKYNGGLPVPATRSTEFLSNKALFTRRCREYGLPVVAVLGVFENGQLVHCDGDEPGLPTRDLFVKMLRGTGGRGAERWEYQGDGLYRDSRGTVLTAAALIAHLKALSLSNGSGAILQPRLVNHPDIADLSNGALATVRALTCRDERGGAELTNAALRMAQGSNTVVDNFHAVGIVAKIDIRTGEVGRAIDGGMLLDPGRGWCEKHPDTGAPILGRKLPYWQETVDLVCRAHAAAFPDQVIIGWDVALLSDGPRLIEGNKGPDVDLVQKSHQEGLGNTRFGQLLAFNLRRTLARRSAVPQST